MQTTTSSSVDSSTCLACNSKLPEGAFFCPQCGRAANSSSSISRTKKFTIIICIALLIFVPAMFFQDWKAGSIPTETVATLGQGPLKLEPRIEALQQAANKSPNDIKIQNEYAAALVGIIRDSEKPEEGILLETIEQLSKVLSLNPLEPDALLALADISFNQQVFNKASELYHRFLALHPDDNDVRARYGSSLMFLGDFAKSIEQQKLVLSKDPKNFQASAYLSIAIGQSGDLKTARIAAKKALELAPNEEAKKRLEAFISSLDKKPAESVNKTGAPVASQERGNITKDVSDSFEQALRANPIAGPKVVSVSVKSGVATAVMHDFPMQAMPPFAKDKFFGSLAAAAKRNAVTSVIFVDQASGQEMDRKEF